MHSTISMAGTHRAKLIKGTTTAPLGWKIRNALRPSFLLGYLANHAAKLFSALTGIPTLTAELRLLLVKATGERIDYGVVSYRVVTTAFATFVVDQLQVETVAFGDFKYHANGTGIGAEAVGDVALGTDSGVARAAGTQTETSAQVYQSVGTLAFISSLAITEHGLFNALTGVTLMDRSVFAAVNVVSGDSIQNTYSLSVNAGG